MELLPVPLRRLGYRGAYAGLRVYWFLFRPSSQGVKCVLTDGERILLVRHTYGASNWELPGGGRRRNEAPAVAARREMREELGLAIQDWTRLGETIIDVDNHHDRVQFLRAELSSPEVEINRAELSDFRWFPRDALPSDLGRYARAIIASLPRG